jgi:hypothetical protein
MNVNNRTQRAGLGLVASSIHARDSAAIEIASGDRRRAAKQMTSVLQQRGFASERAQLITDSWTTALARQRDAISELGGLLRERAATAEAEIRIRNAMEAAELASAQPEHRGSADLSNELQDLQLQLGDNLADADGLQDLIGDARTRLASARQQARQIERLVFAEAPAPRRTG